MKTLLSRLGYAGFGALWTLAALTPAASQAGHLNAVLAADLSGREEVAADAADQRLVGDPDGAGEIYVFGIDGDPATLCYVLLVERIGELAQAPGNGRQAHIHEAARGVNGPVVAALAWPQDGQAGDCLTEGEGAGTPGAKFPTAETGIVQRILANPTQFYVNVHNAEYPAGALRGQLERDHID
jgi:hypothetical protein